MPVNCRYGGQLVADDLDRNCTTSCQTGGTIVSTFFCVIYGSIALGQVDIYLLCVYIAMIFHPNIFRLIHCPSQHTYR